MQRALFAIAFPALSLIVLNPAAAGADGPSDAYAHWQSGLSPEKQDSTRQALTELHLAVGADHTPGTKKDALKRVTMEARR